MASKRQSPAECIGAFGDWPDSTGSGLPFAAQETQDRAPLAMMKQPGVTSEFAHRDPDSQQFSPNT